MGDNGIKGDVKNEGAPDTLNIKVKDSDNNEVHFKVKKTTKFEKIMEAFCKKKGVDKANTRFIFDGQRINGQQTPNDLDMEDDDTIEVMMEQVGGR
mmetsp:Transcript_35541/g.68122  ORF Transcript_35541/g.68122 Transcript_35541/m.68122 type:complete len:96 (-) Transcript_35541:390-677(-)